MRSVAGTFGCCEECYRQYGRRCGCPDHLAQLRDRWWSDPVPLVLGSRRQSSAPLAAATPQVGLSATGELTLLQIAFSFQQRLTVCVFDAVALGMGLRVRTAGEPWSDPAWPGAFQWLVPGA